MNLGNAIKYVREKRGITLETLARQTGYSVHYLRQIEDGELSPLPEETGVICFRLDVAVPSVSFLALEESDVAEHKREAFNLLRQPMLNLIDQFLIPDAEPGA